MTGNQNNDPSSHGEKQTPKNITPEQNAAIEIGDALRQFRYTLWGHGTPHFSGSDSFFQEGIRKSEGSRLTETAIPLDATNIHLLDDWPHKKHNPEVDVVLLAVPFADPSQGITVSDVDQYGFKQAVSGGRGGWVWPREKIVGYYDANAKALVPNPEFELGDDSHQEQFGAMKERKELENGKHLPIDKAQSIGKVAMGDIPVSGSRHIEIW